MSYNTTMPREQVQGNSGVGISIGRVQGIQVHERALCADSIALGHIDSTHRFREFF